MEFIVRKAEPKDAVGIAIVSVYTWKTTYSGLMPDAMLDRRIADIEKSVDMIRNDIIRHNNYFVAEVENTIIAFTAICSPCRNPDYSDSGEIGALYCLKGFSRKGIGKALFLTAVQELVNKGHRTMLIDCLKGNSALDFYQHMGGRVVEEKEVQRIDHSRTEVLVFYDDIEKLLG